MPWNDAGKLLSGPPTASGSKSNGIDRRYRPNLGGLNAFQREQQLAARYSRKGKEPAELEGRTDWDVLKENHRFIRDDEEPGEVSWEERLARAYESKLFKEFALIDLKHYKSRRLALRWRTAEEVVDGIGEDTCASLRCKYHSVPGRSSAQVDFDDDEGRSRRKSRSAKKMPPLRAFELPFVYQEAGERKEALVKVKLCRRCEAKLTWKPGRGLSDEEDLSEEDATTRSGRNNREESHRRRNDDEEMTRSHHHGRREKRDRSRHRSRSTSASPPRRDRRKAYSPDRDSRRVLL